MKFFCLGDEDTVLGFRLVGLEGRAVKSAAEAREAFAVATATQDVGIILMTERAARLIREEVEDYIYNSDFPLVLEIPDSRGPLPDRKSISDLIKEAVGISI